jgi:hypothetical protein
MKTVLHDFGYYGDLSFADETEIQRTSPLEDKVVSLHTRMNEIRKIYLPLLEKLSEQPDKDLIKWPGRKGILDQYKEKLIKLTDTSQE